MSSVKRQREIFSNQEDESKIASRKSTKSKPHICYVCSATETNSPFLMLEYRIGCDHGFVFCETCFTKTLNNQYNANPCECFINPVLRPSTRKNFFTFELAKSLIEQLIDDNARRRFEDAHRKWNHKFHRWGRCPSPGCGALTEILRKKPTADPTFICRTCGTRTCWKCMLGYHPSDVSCQAFRNRIESKMERRGSVDSSDVDGKARWLLELEEQTSHCPKCGERFERIVDGHSCSHMTCSRCKHEFKYQPLVMMNILARLVEQDGF